MVKERYPVLAEMNIYLDSISNTIVDSNLV